jgi:hypothetical protein
LNEITLGTKEKGMPISIDIIACLECCCHICVPQLVYFDKIHHAYYVVFFLLFPFSHFSQMRNDSFRGVGSQMCSANSMSLLTAHPGELKIVKTDYNRPTCANQMFEMNQ